MDVHDQLPLTETTFYIVISLASGPKHGYAIMKEVETLSEGRVTLSTSTLYGGLKRMLESGWIERVPDPQPDENDRERKAYCLTKLGRGILQAETERLRRLANVAELRAAREAI